MIYSLRRLSDGAGDSGQMSNILDYANDNYKENGAPRLGCAIRVGSIYSRTYANQDYWTTTPVTEIVSDNTVNDVRTIVFKTKNSEYEWKEF